MQNELINGYTGATATLECFFLTLPEYVCSSIVKVNRWSLTGKSFGFTKDYAEINLLVFKIPQDSL